MDTMIEKETTMDDTTTTTTTDRDTHERATLAELALADGWTGWAGRIGDVPTTTDWLCAASHKIKAWTVVNSILREVVAGSISIADARRDLGRVLS